MYKMRKGKAIAAAVTLCLLMALSGCGEKTAGGDAKKDVGGAKDTPKKVEYTKGTLTDTNFESEFIGLRYDAPENCIMATEEDMDSMVDFGGELIYSDKDKKILDYAKASTVYEMMCSDAATNANVIVMVEKLPLTNMTIDQYIDALKQNLDKTGMGYTYGDKTSGTIAGQEYIMFTGTFTSSGTTVKQEYNLRKVDNRMIVICASYIDGDTEARETIMSGFKPF